MAEFESGPGLRVGAAGVRVGLVAGGVGGVMGFGVTTSGGVTGLGIGLRSGVGVGGVVGFATGGLGVGGAMGLGVTTSGGVVGLGIGLRSGVGVGGVVGLGIGLRSGVGLVAGGVGGAMGLGVTTSGGVVGLGIGFGAGGVGLTAGGVCLGGVVGLATGGLGVGGVMGFGVTTSGGVVLGGVIWFGAGRLWSPAGRVGRMSTMGSTRWPGGPGRRTICAAGSLGWGLAGLCDHCLAVGPAATAGRVARLIVGPRVNTTSRSMGRQWFCSYRHCGCQPDPTSTRRLRQSRQLPSHLPLVNLTLKKMTGAGCGRRT